MPVTLPCASTAATCGADDVYAYASVPFPVAPAGRSVQRSFAVSPALIVLLSAVTVNDSANFLT